MAASRITSAYSDHIRHVSQRGLRGPVANAPVQGPQSQAYSDTLQLGNAGTLHIHVLRGELTYARVNDSTAT